MTASALTANKTRSPNYPSIGLGEATQKIKTIYGKQRQYPATREVLAKSLGYGGVNGASATLISALSKYGLIDGYGDKLKVSDIGRDLALHQRGDPEYAEALRAAASMPAFFQELRVAFPDGLPDSEHLTRAFLVKRGFNDKAIGNAVRAYRDTMAFVDEELGTDVATSDSVFQDEAAVQAQAEHFSPAATQLSPPAPSGHRQKSVQLPLSLSQWATLQADFPLSESAWNQMLAVLTAMKPALVTPSEPSLPSSYDTSSVPAPDDHPLPEA